MVLIRDVFHCKFGQGDEVVSVLTEMFGDKSRNTTLGVNNARVLTDISGRYFTVVLEVEMESVDAHLKVLEASFANADFAKSFSRLPGAVEWGHREYYNVELG